MTTHKSRKSNKIKINNSSLEYKKKLLIIKKLNFTFLCFINKFFFVFSFDAIEKDVKRSHLYNLQKKLFL